MRTSSLGRGETTAQSDKLPTALLASLREALALLTYLPRGLHPSWLNMTFVTQALEGQSSILRDRLWCRPLWLGTTTSSVCV